MDENNLAQSISDELVRDWEIISTGTGYLVRTDWQWPNRERIEIYLRNVGERSDLFIVTDGGELFNFLFSQGVDISKDKTALKVLNEIFDHYGLKMVDYQMVKGAGEADLGRAVRVLLEALKDTSNILWHKLEQKKQLH